MNFWQFLSENMAWFFLFGLFVLPVIIIGVGEVIKQLRKPAPKAPKPKGIHINQVSGGRVHIEARDGEMRIRATKGSTIDISDDQRKKHNIVVEEFPEE